jgi:hypothetical protein
VTKLETRTVRVAVLLTPVEAQLVGRRANALGLSRSGLIRNLVLGALVPVESVQLELPADAARALLAALQHRS